MKVTNVMKSSNLKWLGLFLLLFGIIVFQNSCSSSKGGNGVSVAYSPNKTSATVNGYTESNGKLTWHDSEYNRDFDVEAVNQQGTPLPNIHVQIFSGSNAAFAIFIDPTFTYQPYITTVTDQLGSSVSTTSLSGLSLLPEDLTTIATPVKVVGTLLNIRKTAISQGFDISPQYNLTPQDVQLLMNELPSFSPKQFYDTNTDASNALGVDLVNRSVTTAIVFVGGCAAGAVIGGGWNLGVGAAPGCLAGASIVSALTGIFGGQQAGPMDIFTIESGIASLFANEPVDQRYTIADLQANDLAGDLASYVIHVPGGKSKVILPIEPDSLSITPMALTFITIPSTQNVSVMASYTYFNQKRGPADYNSGRFSFILNPTNIANIGVSGNNFQVTKLVSGTGTVTFNFNDGVVDRTGTVSIGGSNPTIAVGSYPSGIAIDASGNVWVTNNGSNTVTELSSTGSTIGTYSVGSGPWGIAIDSSGNVWVANSDTNNVTELSSTGSTIGTYSVGSYPERIAIDSSGNVWVGNYNDATVTKLSSTGISIGTYSVYSGPLCIAIDASGNVWITMAGDSDNNLTELSSTGNTIPSTITGAYTVASTLGGIAIDSSGNVWVANWSNSVTKLSSTGSIIGTYSVGTNPVGIAIDGSGNVWVANYGGSTVTELSSTGSIIGTYSVGANPIGIAIDATGNVWVTNSSDNTVTKLVGLAKGPQYFPYKGPQFPGGGNF